MCRLVMNLYGHPRAGNGWERHAEAVCRKHGFRPVPEWPSTFWHPERKVVLVVYVDDLVASGPEAATRQCLVDLRKDLVFAKPEVIGKYLSCVHKFQKVDPTTTAVRLEMSDYLAKSVNEFKTEYGIKYKHVPTLYIPERGLPVVEAREAQEGRMGEMASHYLMCLLYGARLALPQLIVAVTRLAGRVSKWSAECDDRLIRLYDYAHDRIQDSIHGSLSTTDSQVAEIWAWPDADLAGDKLFSSKSTSGRFIEIVGANGRGMPLHWATNKQTGTALSTSDAETVSLRDCIKMEALAIQSFFSMVLGRPIVLRVMEDNTTCITAVDKGYSQAMRYLPRTQRTSLGFLHEVFHEIDGADIGPAILQHASTKKHKGDFFTKDSLTAEEFNKALVSLRIHGSFEDFLRGERNSQGIKPPKALVDLAKEVSDPPPGQDKS